MLTPVVATREVYFLRHCKQLSADQWAIVDFSIDKGENNIEARFSRRPSGCIIEDKSNGHSKVTIINSALKIMIFHKLSPYISMN